MRLINQLHKQQTSSRTAPKRSALTSTATLSTDIQVWEKQNASTSQHTASEVVTTKLPDGTYAVTFPSLPEPQRQEITPVSCTSTSAKTDMQYLQNLLPNCKFEGCTINIHHS